MPPAASYQAMVTIKGTDVPPNWEEHVHEVVVREMILRFGNNVTVEQLDEWGVPVKTD